MSFVYNSYLFFLSYQAANHIAERVLLVHMNSFVKAMNEYDYSLANGVRVPLKLVSLGRKEEIRTWISADMTTKKLEKKRGKKFKHKEVYTKLMKFSFDH